MRLLLFFAAASAKVCPTLVINPYIPSTDYLLDNVFADHDCTASNLGIAGTVATEGEWKGEIIGYRGGQCAFVKEQSACEPNSIFNFLELYYCDIYYWFCDWKFWIMLPIVVSKQTFIQSFRYYFSQLRCTT